MTASHPIYDGSLVQREPKSAWVLYPYLMPRSVDEFGDDQEQGRYCIAYSRDGWWLIDSEDFKVLRWCVSEQGAIGAREEIIGAESAAKREP